MNRKPSNKEIGPEAKIKADVIKYLKLKDWYILVTHGNAFQSGLPDLYICHQKFGTRWLEIKNKEKYAFTKAQMETFPMLTAMNVGIWIMTEATAEEYKKLFQRPNWYHYLEVMK